MAFNNTAPLSYAQGEVVKYIDAQRGLSEEVGGPKVTIVGLLNPNSNDIFDISRTTNTTATARIAANTTSQQLFAANTARKGMVIINEDSSARCLIRYGSAANDSNYTYRLEAGYTFEMGQPIWQGNVHVITTSSTANVQGTDLR
jgi:hypothetical protein